MAVTFRKFIKGILLRGELSDVSDNLEGSLFHNSSDSKIKAYIQGAVREVVTSSQSQNLTNKILVDVALNNIGAGVTGSSLETNLSSSAASNKLPTAAAAKSYADSASAAAASAVATAKVSKTGDTMTGTLIIILHQATPLKQGILL